MSAPSLFFHRVIRLPASGAVLLIRFYQLVLSPMKVAIFGPGGACRFHPTCSEYGIETIRRHGLLLGLGRTTWRILKCHPFHPGGYDPVPPRRCSHGTAPDSAARGDHRQFSPFSH